MKKTTKFMTPILAAGMVFGFSSLSPSAESVTTIEEGDTLWSIAQNHHMTTEELMNINHNLNPNSLPIGTEILLERVDDDNSDEEKVTHTVQPGNTLWNIANIYDGVTVEHLINENSVIDPYALSIGSELTILSSDGSGNSVTHTVQPGNTLWNIASVYNGVTVNDLREANPNVDPLALPIGSTLTIPTS